jgi:hypothetical protein
MLALTTTFTPPPQCTQSGHATILNVRQSQVWLNEPFPDPQATITSCYPPEVGISLLAAASGVSLAAFQTLVCPAAWETALQAYMADGPTTSTYIACCPTYVAARSLSDPSSAD